MRSWGCVLQRRQSLHMLELLARNLSNNEVAQATGVGEQTVNWHLKNLFGKFNAANRRHVVRRAPLLGLVEGLE